MPRISENFVENSEPHQRFERAFYRREKCKDEWMQNCVKVSVYCKSYSEVYFN